MIKNNCCKSMLITVTGYGNHFPHLAINLTLTNEYFRNRKTETNSPNCKVEGVFEIRDASRFAELFIQSTSEAGENKSH
jgi:hypothetical protein